jgi:hypothetical protein
MIDYVKVSILSGLCLALFGSGYWMGYSRYIEFKKSVEVVAKTQEAKVESIQKQHELVTKGIANEYEAKLSALRNYYRATSVWNNSSSGKVSGISTAPTIADVATSYNLLAGQCAETTQQVVSLQDWIRQQIGIK